MSVRSRGLDLLGLGLAGTLSVEAKFGVSSTTAKFVFGATKLQDQERNNFVAILSSTYFIQQSSLFTTPKGLKLLDIYCWII
jgi:hypothetical protein